MRKPVCICQNKAFKVHICSAVTMQLIVLLFWLHSTIPLLPKSKISSLQPSSVAVHSGLCGTLLETMNSGFPGTWLKRHKTGFS